MLVHIVQEALTLILNIKRGGVGEEEDSNLFLEVLSKLSINCYTKLLDQNCSLIFHI